MRGATLKSYIRHHRVRSFATLMIPTIGHRHSRFIPISARQNEVHYQSISSECLFCVRRHMSRHPKRCLVSCTHLEVDVNITTEPTVLSGTKRNTTQRVRTVSTRQQFTGHRFTPEVPDRGRRRVKLRQWECETRSRSRDLRRLTSISLKLWVSQGVKLYAACCFYVRRSLAKKSGFQIDVLRRLNYRGANVGKLTEDRVVEELLK
jgi:hypothetical protein